MFNRSKKIASFLLGLVLGSVLTNVSYADDSQWRSLFNGSDLANWQQVGPGGFTIEDGLLKSSGGMGLLWYTPQKIGDAEIRVVFKNPGGKNSGVFIRIPEQPTEPWMPVNRGYEVQIDNNADEFHATGVFANSR
jgi:hypothetical protein